MSIDITVNCDVATIDSSGYSSRQVSVELSCVDESDVASQLSIDACLEPHSISDIISELGEDEILNEIDVNDILAYLEKNYPGEMKDLKESE